MGNPRGTFARAYARDRLRDAMKRYAMSGPDISAGAKMVAEARSYGLRGRSNSQQERDGYAQAAFSAGVLADELENQDDPRAEIVRAHAEILNRIYEEDNSLAHRLVPLVGIQPDYVGHTAYTFDRQSKNHVDLGDGTRLAMGVWREGGVPDSGTDVSLPRRVAVNFVLHVPTGPADEFGTAPKEEFSHVLPLEDAIVLADRIHPEAGRRLRGAVPELMSHQPGNPYDDAFNPMRFARAIAMRYGREEYRAISNGPHSVNREASHLAWLAAHGDNIAGMGLADMLGDWDHPFAGIVGRAVSGEGRDVDPWDFGSDHPDDLNSLRTRRNLKYDITAAPLDFVVFAQMNPQGSSHGYAHPESGDVRVQYLKHPTGDFWNVGFHTHDQGPREGTRLWRHVLLPATDAEVVEVANHFHRLKHPTYRDDDAREFANHLLRTAGLIPETDFDTSEVPVADETDLPGLAPLTAEGRPHPDGMPDVSEPKSHDPDPDQYGPDIPPPPWKTSRVGVVSRYAAYRAPAGGMVVRGTFYKGGKLIPDLEKFLGPEKLERIRKRVKGYKKPKQIPYKPYQDAGLVVSYSRSRFKRSGSILRYAAEEGRFQSGNGRSLRMNEIHGIFRSGNAPADEGEVARRWHLNNLGDVLRSAVRLARPEDPVHQIAVEALRTGNLTAVRGLLDAIREAGHDGTPALEQAHFRHNLEVKLLESGVHPADLDEQMQRIEGVVPDVPAGASDEQYDARWNALKAEFDRWINGNVAIHGRTGRAYLKATPKPRVRKPKAPPPAPPGGGTTSGDSSSPPGAPPPTAQYARILFSRRLADRGVPPLVRHAVLYARGQSELGRVFNAEFVKGARKVHDSLPQRDQESHRPALDEFEKMDHFGSILRFTQGDEDKASDVATEMLYGRNGSFFGKYNPSVGNLKARFLSYANGITKTNRKKDASGPITETDVSNPEHGSVMDWYGGREHNPAKQAELNEEGEGDIGGAGPDWRNIKPRKRTSDRRAAVNKAVADRIRADTGSHPGRLERFIARHPGSAASRIRQLDVLGGAKSNVYTEVLRKLTEDKRVVPVVQNGKVVFFPPDKVPDGATPVASSEIVDRSHTRGSPQSVIDSRILQAISRAGDQGASILDIRRTVRAVQRIGKGERAEMIGKLVNSGRIRAKKVGRTTKYFDASTPDSQEKLGDDGKPIPSPIESNFVAMTKLMDLLRGFGAKGASKKEIIAKIDNRNLKNKFAQVLGKLQSGGHVSVHEGENGENVYRARYRRRNARSERVRRYSAFREDVGNLLRTAIQNPHEATVHGAIADALDELYPDNPMGYLLRRQYGLGEHAAAGPQNNLWWDAFEGNPYVMSTRRFLGNSAGFEFHLTHAGSLPILGAAAVGNRRWVVTATPSDHAGGTHSYNFEFPYNEAHRIPQMFPAAAEYISRDPDAGHNLPGGTGQFRNEEAQHFLDEVNAE